MADPQSKQLIEKIPARGDTLAVAQNIPLLDLPEELIAVQGVERFEVRDIAELMDSTPRFQRLARQIPFAIMNQDYQHSRFVVLPESQASLLLYRLIALNPKLYEAAKNREFLALLESLVSEILSVRIAGSAA